MFKKNIELLCVKGISTKKHLICLVGDILELEENTGGVVLHGKSGYCKGYVDIKLTNKQIAKSFILNI